MDPLPPSPLVSKMIITVVCLARPLLTSPLELAWPPEESPLCLWFLKLIGALS